MTEHVYLEFTVGDFLSKLRYSQAISIFKIVTSLWNNVLQKTDNYQKSKLLYEIIAITSCIQPFQNKKQE